LEFGIQASAGQSILDHDRTPLEAENTQAMIQPCRLREDWFGDDCKGTRKYDVITEGITDRGAGQGQSVLERKA
jgi:hypothetical protein